MSVRLTLAGGSLLVAGFALLFGGHGTAQAPPRPLFVDAAAATGLAFTHDPGATGDYFLPEIMGSGAALVDMDNDGDLDVFLVQGAGRSKTSRLFRNDLSASGAGRVPRFTDVTTAAGVGLAAQGMGVAVGDYNNDGFIDLFVTTAGADVLYRNTGKGTFANVTAEAGVSDAAWSTGATFVDYDRDGHLDLFVTNYVDFTPAANRRCADPSGARDYCHHRVYKPVPDRLYRNLGNGRFSDVTTASGVARAFGSGLGVVAGDYNADGWLDLYVANDAMPNQLWINRRNGTFVDQGFLSGAAVNASGSPEASMGIASGDYDVDGDEDLFVTNLVGETFVLYQNAGGLFEDVRTRAGLGAPTAAVTGFGTDWFDYDNDGWQDLFIANGAVSIVARQRGEPRPYRFGNQLFRNNGAGRFVETTSMAGADLARPDVGRGAAFGDVDNDGDVDVLVTSNGGAVRLLLNQHGAAQHWLMVQLEQAPRNRGAIGAWVGLERSGRSTQWRRVKTDGSYLSASDPRLHFGLGPSTAIGAVLVQWPDGVRERFTSGLGADRLLRLRRGAGAVVPAR